jgi:hypothetical protein
VLAHAGVENARQKVQALVFVGDAMEETPADLYAAAREVGLPVFLFQEGDDSEATRVFREIARLTKGAHCRFDPGSAKQLGELLRAVAVYAAGGDKALSARGNAGALKLLQQLMRRHPRRWQKSRSCLPQAHQGPQSGAGPEVAPVLLRRRCSLSVGKPESIGLHR